MVRSMMMNMLQICDAFVLEKKGGVASYDMIRSMCIYYAREKRTREGRRSEKEVLELHFILHACSKHRFFVTDL